VPGPQLKHVSGVVDPVRVEYFPASHIMQRMAPNMLE
jgi:hypothetical protein